MFNSSNYLLWFKIQVKINNEETVGFILTAVFFYIKAFWLSSIKFNYLMTEEFYK